MSQTPPNRPSAFEPESAENAPFSLEENLAGPASAEVDALASLTNEVSDLKAKNADLAEQFLRAKAEAENTRRRAEEEMSKARKFAVESFARVGIWSLALECLPYLFSILAVTILCAFVPEIALWLPNYVMGPAS